MLLFPFSNKNKSSVKTAVKKASDRSDVDMFAQSVMSHLFIQHFIALIQTAVQYLTLKNSLFLLVF